MSTIKKGFSPVDRQLEAYHDSWKRDHTAAIACRDWEDAIAVGVSVFHMLRDREKSWRQQVFSGSIPFSDEENADQRGRFVHWLDTTTECLASILPGLERRFANVEGHDELRQCAAMAARIVRDWKPPRLSMSLGLLDMTLEPEAAAELDRILNEARANPPVRIDSEVEIKDASFLKRLLKGSHPT